jgi:hypothetical protein
MGSASLLILTPASVAGKLTVPMRGRSYFMMDPPHLTLTVLLGTVKGRPAPSSSLVAGRCLQLTVDPLVPRRSHETHT